MQNNRPAAQSIAMDEVKLTLFQMLNSQRSHFKKKPFKQDCRADLLANHLLSQNVNQQDQKFSTLVKNYGGIVSQTNPEYLVFDRQQAPKYSQFTDQEIKEGFEKAFDDMINSVYKTKLLTSSTNTHIGIGLMLTGLKGDVFRVSTFVTKKALFTSEVLRCNNSQDSGLLWSGTILDPTKKVSVLVVNKGENQQIVVGPNRMSYDESNGVFKIGLPDNYLGANINIANALSANLQNYFEIFVTAATDQNFVYGQGNDLAQNFNFSAFELGISELMAPFSAMQVTTASLTSQFSNHARGNQVTGISRISTIGTSQDNGVRKTKTQLLREQNAAIKAGKVQGNGVTGFIAVPQSNAPQSQTQQPHSRISWVSNANQNGLNQAVQNKQGPAFQMVLGNQKNEKGADMSFAFTNPQSQKVNPFPSPNFTVQPNVSLFPQQQQQSSLFNIQSPAIQNNTFATPNQNFQSQLQQQRSLFQQQKQQSPVIQTQVPNQQNTPLVMLNNQHQQTSLTRQSTSQQQFLPNPSNQVTQQPQQQQFAFNFQNPQNNSMPQFQTSSQQQTQPFPSLFLQQNQQQQCSAQQQQPQINQQQQQNQLTKTEVEFIHHCIDQMKPNLSAQEIFQIQQLLMHSPRETFDMLIIAYTQLQQQNTMNSTKQESKEPPKDKQFQKIQHYDDITLFIMTLPSYLIPNSEKYSQIVKGLEEGRISHIRALEKLVLKSKSPVNDSFKDLYNRKQTADLILSLRREEYYCHAIVFASGGDYFKQVLSRYEEINKQDSTSKQTLGVPDWMDSKAFQLLLKFLYTGRLSESSDTRKPTEEECFNLLKIANFFFISNLQEQIVAEIIIPQMSINLAIDVLKECVPENSSHHNSPSHLWPLLIDYCMFYIAKNLPTFLRQHSHRISTFDCDTLYKIIERSLYFLVDGGQDLENILTFTAELWTNKDVFEVLKKCQSLYEKCMSFDYQIVPQMKDFLHRNVDPSTSYQCLLIKGEEEKLESQSIATGPVRGRLDSSFEVKEQYEGSNTGVLGNMFQESIDSKIAELKPAHNFVKDIDGKKQVSSGCAKVVKEPIFFMKINLEDQKEFIKKNNGVSIISEAFDFGRRSWQLKLDIDAENNISYWIIERGPKIFSQQRLELGQNLPIQFSSVLIEFEVVDAALGERKTPIFYSFAHDSHQIIGQKNALNVSQLQNKSQIYLRLHMKDFILHSSLLHFFTTNFQNLFNLEYKMMKGLLIGNQSAGSQNLWNNQVMNRGLLSLPYFTVFQMLKSDMLRVDLEDEALYFLHKYLLRFGSMHPKAVDFACNSLTTCLRFSFLSLPKELSVIRDNEFMRRSSSFINKVRAEMIIRQNLAQTVLIIKPTSDQTVQEQTRKFYDLQRVMETGRKKYELLKGDKKQSSAMLDEVLVWAVQSQKQTGKQGHNTEQEAENRMLREQVAEEKRQYSKLLTDYNQMKLRYDQTVINLNTQKSNLQQQMPMKENVNLNNLSFERQNRFQNQNVRSLERPVPSFLVDSSIMDGQKLNNSFGKQGGLKVGPIPQTRPHEYDGQFKQQKNASVQMAERKLQNNFQQDISAILKDLSPQRKVIGHYKSQSHKNKDEEEKCTIF